MANGQMNNSGKPLISIIIPAKNEAKALAKLLPEITNLYPDGEIIVVDDGSTDDTLEIATNYASKVIRNPHSLGNGAAIKTGARNASGEIIVTLDGDGQHRAVDIQKLINPVVDDEFDMVVGARDSAGQAGHARLFANTVYNWISSKIANYPIQDLTSGMRACRADLFHQFLYLFPNGFSYPTTITMAMLRNGYRVGYQPIDVLNRVGESHIRPIRDGLRFLLIIFKIGSLYSPLKLFMPISAMLFATASVVYGYSWIDGPRLTNGVILLYMVSLLVFLIGTVAEQITQLIYKAGGN